MEEEKKDKGEVERGKEGGGGKKKMERLPKPGFPGNPSRCGQGLKCPWVDGERGPRCRLWHPESSTGSIGIALHCIGIDNAAMKTSGEEKYNGMTEEVQKEEAEYVEEKGVGKKAEKDMGKRGENKMDNLSASDSLLKSAPQIKKYQKLVHNRCARCNLCNL